MWKWDIMQTRAKRIKNASETMSGNQRGETRWKEREWEGLSKQKPLSSCIVVYCLIRGLLSGSYLHRNLLDDSILDESIDERILDESIDLAW